MGKITVKEILNCTQGKLLSGTEETVVLNFSTNSLEIKEGDMFVPIIGERTDGHKYIDSALEKGAVATLTSKNIDTFVNNKAFIMVEDTLKALQAIAEYMRSRLPLPIVGITGSVGKTTTKEMIWSVLSTRRNTFKTKGNMNSQIGLSLMMTRLETSNTAAVIEMGVSEPNEMVNLSRIAKPDYYVMTNIGVSHIGQFKTRENICKEKANIVTGFKMDNSKTYSYDLDEINCLFVNGDDDQLKRLARYAKAIQNEDSQVEDCDLSLETKVALKNTKVVTFGIDGDYDYVAKNIEVVNGQTHFDMQYDNKSEHIVLNVLGKHNIYNALVAIAVGKCFNIEPKVAKEALYNYQPIKMRGTIEDINGIKVIDDTYNASPDSMKSGIDVLLTVDGVNKRVAVLADILELGDMSYECHYSVGEYIANKNVDELITVGKEARAIAEAASKHDNKMVVSTFNSNDEVKEYLDKLEKGYALLVKGSRGMHTDEIVDYIRNK